MGPEDNTPEWDKQINIITTVINYADLKDESEIDRMIVLYAMDESFSRSAILEARRQITDKVRGNGQVTNTR